MKRVLFVILAVCSVAPAASGGCWITPSTRKVELHVGEWIDIILRPTWSGIVHYGPPAWVYVSSSERVAHVEGEELVACGPQKTYRITGMGPGEADLVPSHGGTPASSGIVNITVTCGVEDPIQVATPNVATRVNAPVALRVESAIAHRTVFTWYRGHIGDTTQPLAGSGPEISFTADVPGPHYVWVQATTPCATSAGAFRIDVHLPKRRSVR